MQARHIFIILIFFNTIFSFSQEKATLTGKLSIENKIVSDAVVELQNLNNSKFSISDKKGYYKFSNLNIGDSIVIKFRQLGYRQFIKKIKINEVSTIVDINLSEIETENLQEVIIKGKENTINSARKFSYKINSKDFIPNAKANEAISTVPNLYINNNDNEITVDGTLTAKVFIDGIEAMTTELNTLDAKNIDRVEVMSNPSGSYGTEFTGAVVNIITKKVSEDFIKGSITASRSLRLDNWFIDPSLSYKRKWLIIKSTFEYKKNNQNIDYSLLRNTPSNDFSQFNRNESKGNQKSSETRINIKFSEKSQLNLSNELFSYSFDKNAMGFTSLNLNNPINFISKGLTSQSEWNITSVYNYKLKENKIFYYKSKYLDYHDINNGSFIFNDNSSNFYDLKSRNKEFTNELNYEAEDIVIFKKKSAFYSGLKFINRKFEFSNSLYYVNQNISSIFTELDTEWSDKFSTDISFIFENTLNSNTILLNQKYNYILPTINGLYHFKNKYDARFSFSKRILRPNATDLNDALYLINPSIAKQGNSNLNPQIRNYYSFSINKGYKANNFSLKFYNESINNSIVDTYKTVNNLLIQTLENAAKYNSIGMNFGIRTKLFKKINTNLNSGFDYNTFEDNSVFAVIRKNSGYTFRGNINLSSNFFKNKLSASFSGNQNGPNYTLLSKNIFNPYFDFRLATNVLKNKVNISLYARNIFGNASNINLKSNFEDFKQNIEIRNNTSNIALTIVYNFGKIFDDDINQNEIQNDDIRK